MAGSIKGIGMIILQALRVFTIITLLTAGAACWILIINVEKHKPFFVFECISLFFTSAFASLLVISELAFANFIKVYLRRAWPVLSDHHGLGWLGGGMLVIGCNVLSQLNRSEDDTKALGGPFSSLVLAAGILCFVFGVLNILCSLIFCDRKEGINSRDIRANGSLARRHSGYVSDYESRSRSSSSSSASLRNEKTRSKFKSMFLKKEGGGNLPQYTPRHEVSRPYIVHRQNLDVERAAGVDNRASPIIPGVTRPESALHPIHIHSRKSSKYSEADMSRF